MFFKKLSSTKGTDRKTHSFKISTLPLTRQSVEITIKTYSFKYKFSSPSNEWFEWSWKYKRLETNEMINKFGISKSIFEPFQATEINVKSRNRIIKTSLFKKEGNVIFPDFNRMIPFYMGLRHLFML